MALFLHLSDIHLGDEDSKAQALGDYKTDVVPLSERENRISALGDTLAQIDRHLREERRQELDALIVSGDITLAGSERGFQLLDNILDRLGKSRPPPEKIVVVPGNHDVEWFTPPSDSKRYELFVKYVRNRGFVTPPLDGVDTSLKETSPLADLAKHALIDPEFRWAIIPMSSANYCGSLDSVDKMDPSLWDTWASTLDAVAHPVKAADVFRKIRLRDMPRVSHWQLTVLRTLFQHIDRQARARRAHINKVVVFHHHLLPVSSTEENKPFESFANLGLLRAFLGEHRVSVVLHGHKHTPFVYRDLVQPFSGGKHGTPHGVLVVSGGTVGFGAPTADACRLLDLRCDRVRAPVLSIQGIPAVAAGQDLHPSEAERHLLWNGADAIRAPGPTIVQGATAHETYERIQTLFDDVDVTSEFYTLVASVADAGDAQELPPTYPSVPPGVTDKQKWFSDLVSWWQSPRSKLGDALNFTHGSRILQYAGTIDQVDRAIELLRNPVRASRAVIALVDPRVDEPTVSRYPAFCLLQFILRRTNDHKLFLDAVAFFRKQEMRYWWPVNVAEVALLHKTIFDQIKSTHSGLRRGSITTVAAIAHAGNGPPYVAVPELDRMFDMDEKSLWDMAYSLVWREMSSRDEFHQRWQDMLIGLIPSPDVDAKSTPVAVHGLRFLLDTLKRFKAHHPGDEIRQICDLLDRLLEKNTAHAILISSGKVKESDHKEWTSRVQAIVTDLRKMLAKAFATPGTSHA